MTPMVDVTFLLLIFFMVTASFTLQKSLEQPHAKSEEPSTQVEEQEEMLDDYVQVTIDQTNTFYVTTRDDDEVECPSDSEMRSRVKDAKDSTSATRLIILAHVDSTHEKVVTAWDTGVVNNMEQIEIQTTDEEF
jgi:biopolymer transport protein ExbD